MQSIKRDFTITFSISALALACALCWGGPFVASSSAQTANTMQQPNTQPQVQAQARSITGTVVKAGNEYVLRASDGQTYKLDNASQASAYEGKTVTVTGTVDAQSKTIQVQSIAGGRG